MQSILLNVDAGELEDEPPELARLAHVLHVACGGHAGDDGSMRRTLQRVARAGSRAGAHPSYPDREGFGRRPMELPLPALKASVHAQCLALLRHAEALDMTIVSVKPHGALYHAAAREPDLARLLVVTALELFGPLTAIVGPPAGALRDAATALELPYQAEAFADRGYASLDERPLTLLPRSSTGALITDPALAVTQARALLATGAFDTPCVTLCVHGDNPSAVAILEALREALQEMLA